MSDRFEFNDAAMPEIWSLVDRMLEDKLGPMMEAEVKRNTPVEHMHLRDSVKATVDRTEHKLYIEAAGDQMREAENRKYYAAWVDLGHMMVVFGNRTGLFKAPTAFMRKALFRRYPGF